MLDRETIRKIEEFVYKKPRSIQEVAECIGRNWRTADRYIDEIEKESGTVSTRVFRGGTRGALKIVYWSSVEKVSSSIFQEQLEKDIMDGKDKGDFSAFDIYQHVPDRNKKVNAKVASKEEEAGGLEDFFSVLSGAKRQVLFFSGNLSFMHIRCGKKSFLDVIEELVKRGVSIKIICRVDMAGRQNVEDMLSLNFQHGKELIEVRHRRQPLRATIIDGRVMDIKEIGEPTGKAHELGRRMFLFYRMTDKAWVEWLSRVFWKMFSVSIAAEKRLEQLRKIRV